MDVRKSPPSPIDPPGAPKTWLLTPPPGCKYWCPHKVIWYPSDRSHVKIGHTLRIGASGPSGIQTGPKWGPYWAQMVLPWSEYPFPLKTPDRPCLRCLWNRWCLRYLMMQWVQPGSPRQLQRSSGHVWSHPDLSLSLVLDGELKGCKFLDLWVLGNQYLYLLLFTVLIV